MILYPHVQTNRGGELSSPYNSSLMILNNDAPHLPFGIRIMNSTANHLVNIARALRQPNEVYFLPNPVNPEDTNRRRNAWPQSFKDLHRNMLHIGLPRIAKNDQRAATQYLFYQDNMFLAELNPDKSFKRILGCLLCQKEHISSQTDERKTYGLLNKDYFIWYSNPEIDTDPHLKSFKAGYVKYCLPFMKSQGITIAKDFDISSVFRPSIFTTSENIVEIEQELDDFGKDVIGYLKGRHITRGNTTGIKTQRDLIQKYEGTAPESITISEADDLFTF